MHFYRTWKRNPIELCFAGGGGSLGRMDAEVHARTAALQAEVRPTQPHLAFALPHPSVVSLIPPVNGHTVRSFSYARTTVRSERKLDHCLTL